MALRDSDPAEVGGYRIEDRLGSGGMGVVYLARSASGRRLAIKVVHSQYADDDEFRTRFRREVAAARQVSGAFTAPVVDADADAMHPWMATLYIPGADLGTHVREHGPLPLPRLRGLAAGLAEALRDIHRAGVVHRDLKPANVMLAEDGPRVIDFGISRAAEFAASDVLTQTGRVMGTPPFMSPEQFAAPRTSARPPTCSPSARSSPTPPPAAAPSTARARTRRPCASSRASRTSPESPTNCCRSSASAWRSTRSPAPRRTNCSPSSARAAPPARPASTASRHPYASGPAHGRPSRRSPHGPTRRAPSGAKRRTGRPRRRTPGGTRSGASGPTEPRRNSPGRHDPAGTPPAAERTRSRRRPALLLVSAAAAVALTAIVTTTVTLIRDHDRPAPAGDRPASSTAEAAGLPDGWKPWVATAKAPGNSGGGLGGADTSFKNCSVVDASLVCAGSDLMATRFGLADGRNTWSRPVDPTPDGASGDEGALIGTGDGRVYGYGAEDAEGTSGVGSRYTVYALAAGTGKELWRTPTGSGETAMVPDGSEGAATAVSEGVVTFYGSQGDQYALLDAETGEVRWRQPQPGDQGDCTLDSAADRAYLVCASEVNDGKAAATTVSEIDQRTGRTRWTVEAEGSLQMLGRQGGLLVFTDGLSMTRGLTLIDVASHKLTVRRLAEPRPEASRAYLVRGTVYFTRTGGGVRALSPLTGRTLWESNTTLERQGPPTASATRVYFASPSGRLAALNAGSGKVEDTRDGRDDGGRVDSLLVTSGARLLLVGDALYVPYGVRSVYTVDVRDL